MWVDRHPIVDNINAEPEYLPIQTSCYQSMETCKILLCLLALFAVSSTNVSFLVDNRKVQNSAQCEPIGQIPLCSGIGYDYFTLPNFRSQYSAEEARRELEDYYLLIRANCSPAMGTLLCAVYAPLCYERLERNRTVSAILPPCRQLCEHAYEGCKDTIKANNIIWPPGPHLNCSRYPSYKRRGRNLCFSPGPDLSVLKHLEIPTVKAPKLLACKTTLIEPTHAMILLGGFSSTKSNGAALPVVNVECDPANITFTTINGSNTQILTGLEPNTQYDCTIQRNVTDDAYVCQLQFRTPQVLDIEVINNTPNVTNGNIELELKTNRPVSNMTCQLLATNQIRNCLNGGVSFTTVDEGYYTIRIVANNSKTDRATIRLRVRVPRGPDHCAVNLINRQWVVTEGGVRVWFKALGPEGTYIKCCVNGARNCAKCTSPLNLKLAKRENKIRLVPAGPNCVGRVSPRTIKVELP